MRNRKDNQMVQQLKKYITLENIGMTLVILGFIGYAIGLISLLGYADPLSAALGFGTGLAVIAYILKFGLAYKRKSLSERKNDE